MPRAFSIDTFAEREARIAPLVAELRRVLASPPTTPLEQELTLLDLKQELVQLVLNSQVTTAQRQAQMALETWLKEHQPATAI